MKIILVVLFATVAAVAQQSNVVPLLECVSYFPDLNYLTGFFGYTNGNSESVSIPVGPNNYVSPAPDDHGQPTTFLPGTNQGVWPATLDLDTFDSLTWNLQGTAVTATNDSSNYCSF